MARIWVFAEFNQGKLQQGTLELLAKARELGDVEVVALGPGAGAAAEALGKHGAKKVHVNEDKAFAEQLAEPAASTLAGLVEKGSPDLVLFSFTADSREVAGRLAARLGAGAVSNASDVAAAGGGFTASVAYFGGAKVATYKINAKPAIVLLRPKSFEASEVGGSAQVEKIEAVGAGQGARIVNRVVEAGEAIKLEDAKVVVAGGRGLQAPENFKVLEDLAAALGSAAVGASRAVVDAGWVPYSMQVGQTGKTVRPGVYIAVGISGAMQHTVGMKSSKVIISINKDADAPIHKMADLGVVGDALKIVPKLTEAIKAKKG